MDEPRPCPTAVPGYWMYETGGELAPAITAFMRGAPLDTRQIALIRAYLRQWIAAPWQGPRVAELRARINGLTSREAISQWLDDAIDAGIDAL